MDWLEEFENKIKYQHEMNIAEFENNNIQLKNFEMEL